MVKKEKIDFIYIAIPSFYVALLGRWLHYSTGVKYGIDYIDPWVHHFPGSDRKFSRAWFSTVLAKTLEPIAVKKASLITGVAEGYYMGVLERNMHLKGKCIAGAMPYGGEKNDFNILNKLQLQPYLFKKEPNIIDVIYAGVLLPNAVEVFRCFCKEIYDNKRLFENVRFHFIGTGKVLNDPTAYYVKNLAAEFEGLWGNMIFEYPQRIPYLDVLIHLKAADGVLVIGSTQPHYTPSKVFQGALSGKPILALLHEQSTAKEVIEMSECGLTMGFNEENFQSVFRAQFIQKFKAFLQLVQKYDFSTINLKAFEEYSAKSVTAKLADLLNQAVTKK
ncbi:glycosyltransferase family protein [Niastella vici]|uniref:glycosyltransferase family 4 protein n=1 Tax=Niastella vici TaxID=1703345 RepID=UPI001180B5D8|nr:glycosyltransferase family 4 protein [Niastella vici]